MISAISWHSAVNTWSLTKCLLPTFGATEFSVATYFFTNPVTAPNASTVLLRFGFSHTNVLSTIPTFIRTIHLPGGAGIEPFTAEATLSGARFGHRTDSKRFLPASQGRYISCQSRRENGSQQLTLIDKGNL